MTNTVNWRLLSYSVDGNAPRPGLLVNGQVLDIGRGTEANAASTMDVLENWTALRSTLDRLAESIPADAPAVDDVTLHAPVPKPSAIFCASSNYGDHVAEMSAKTLVDKSTTWGPYVFLKTPHSVMDPDTDVRPPVNSEQLDWEIELGVVIGPGGSGIAPEDAYKHIAGYVILNDLSARDLSRMGVFMPFNVDTLSSKSFDTSLPMGPWLTPADAVEDPMDLDLKLWVGEELMQNSSTKWMYYDIAEQVSFLSRSLTLRPGDIIATGTPAGVGNPRGRFLKDGEVVVAEIEGLGRLRNTIRNR
ncbi:2-keto-4-pentenoate hydratase/2-oxohepta-3-ene-1,7-dioic acid hydratase in catechol pathway [Arthrobacter ginsengisoli]|uniref:2-keto-4-pentenoate hydratase/2-oxohepta-3-ene-1,7-dioic acid hydratase in catechol pathway n=1 Tax=Arthrobacter ginsengisoli TaxID=1356565 RepID=A0ABU1UDL8_9MICC|nr:fumarylacetoacetate hydrolase family protein [Arthrobacter ginsengisoli]MDR7083271.1 2-keto-4-pentenoate hydratase/2-oxohepta-3-ene-1,7-dioic acid hydratase in catechol pathway [Arthrobacter ginsengisoli]